MNQKLPQPEIARWLAGLRLVSTAEQILYCAVAGLALIVLMLAARVAVVTGLLLAASHAVIAVAGFYGARRPWTWRLFGLTALSLVHLCAFLLMGMPGVRLLAWVYAGLAAVAVLSMLPSLRPQRLFFDKLNELAGQDEFRWAVTQAPLSLRMELMRRVHRAISENSKSGSGQS